jgi:hypothetical protein
MPLDLSVARKLVSPIYDALTRPGEKDVEALIKSVTSADFQSCGNEGDCANQDAVITRFKGLANVIPDLNWTAKELFVSGENTIIVRGEATGTPIKHFLGQNQPAGLSHHVHRSLHSHQLPNLAFPPHRELDNGSTSAFQQLMTYISDSTRQCEWFRF